MSLIPKVVPPLPSKEPGPRAPMGALVRRTLLGLVCLLLAPTAGVSQEEGEVCLVWLYGPVQGLPPFRCPQRLDGTDGRFCCGSCLAPYCCDFEEARLDQNQCMESWRMLEVFVRAIAAQKEGTSLPGLQDLETLPTSDPQNRGVKSGAGNTTPTSQPRTKKAITEFVLAGVASALILLLVLALILCKCCPCTQDCAAYFYRPRENVPPPDSPVVARSEPRPPRRRSCSPSPPREVFELPPPYEERPPLPPYSLVAPANPSAASRGQDGTTVGPRGPALPGRRSEEEEVAFSQSPTTSGAMSATGPTGEPASAGEGIPEPGAAAAGTRTPEPKAAAAGSVTPELGTTVAGDIAPVQEIAAAGNVTPELGVAVEGDIAPDQEVATTGNVTPEPGAAVAGDITPDQEVAATGNVTPELGVAIAGDITPDQEVAAAGNVTSELGVAIAGDITPDQETATTGNVTPEPGAAIAGDITPEQEPAAGGEPAGGGEITTEQEAAGGGKATAEWHVAGEGVVASLLGSSATGVISTQPAPLEKASSGSSGVSWERESEV